MKKIIKNVIKVIKDKVLYEGKTYNIYEFLKEVKIKKKAVIVLLQSNIYMKKFTIDLKEINAQRVKEIKEAEFGDGEEYLIDYKISKKEKILYMYAVGGGRIVSCLAEDLSSLKVMPIQICVLKFLKKKIKNKDFRCLFFYLGIYYFIDVNNSYILKSYIWHDIQDAEEYLATVKDKEALYIQSGIEIKNNTAVFIDFGGLYSEKIFA